MKKRWLKKLPKGKYKVKIIDSWTTEGYFVMSALIEKRKKHK